MNNNIPNIIIGASIAIVSQAPYVQNTPNNLFKQNINTYNINLTQESTGSYDFFVNDNKFEETVHKFYNNLIQEQKSLPKDILKIMNDNMDYLYEPVPF